MIAFDEAYMGSGDPLKGSRIPGFGARNRTPETSRVHKRRAKSTKPAKPVTKGLARSAVAVIRIDPRTYHVVVKGSRQLVGIVRTVNGAGGKAYSYQIPGAKAHKGFASQNAAVARMLEKS